MRFHKEIPKKKDKLREKKRHKYSLNETPNNTLLAQNETPSNTI